MSLMMPDPEAACDTVESATARPCRFDKKTCCFCILVAIETGACYTNYKKWEIKKTYEEETE